MSDIGIEELLARNKAWAASMVAQDARAPHYCLWALWLRRGGSLAQSHQWLIMTTTPYSDVNAILNSLLAQMRRILGARLVGLYLYGSLVYGDFDEGISDIDLLAVTSSELDDEEFRALDQMQLDLVAQHPQWDDRLEIAYLSTTALKTFRTQNSTIGIISPGEPFHRIQAGADWLMNWYMVREKGVTLFGPSPTTLIDPIAKEDFLQTVREHTAAWAEYVFEARQRKGQAYAILTMCRALYATRHGKQASKRQAALWAAAEFPQWASLIQDALLWREASNDEEVDHNATFGETLRFVHFAIGQVVAMG